MNTLTGTRQKEVVALISNIYLLTFFKFRNVTNMNSYLFLEIQQHKIN
jgi:hypothetical protein